MTETELAKHLGVSTQRLSNWRNRNSVDWEIIFTKCEDMDLNYLVRGIPFAIENDEEFRKIKTEKDYFFRRVQELEADIKGLKTKIYEK